MLLGRNYEGVYLNDETGGLYGEDFTPILPLFLAIEGDIIWNPLPELAEAPEGEGGIFLH